MTVADKAVLRRLGEIIRDQRKASGLTQEQLGERAGVSRQTVYGIERGANEPGMVLFVGLARALEVAPADLMRAVAS